MDNSIGTSMLLRLFPSEKDAAYAHIFKSTFLKFPMVDARGLENFNHAVRLSKEPYPKDDRPRGAGRFGLSTVPQTRNTEKW